MAKRVPGIVLLGASVLAVAAVAWGMGAFDDAQFLPETIFTVTYRDAGDAVVGAHTFAVAPLAGPFSVQPEPLALNVDKERYGRIAAIDVEVRGHVQATDLEANRVDVEVDVQWRNAHGGAGEVTGEDTLVEKADRFKRKALVSERFKVEFEPMVTGAQNVCGGVADNAVPQFMNITANIEAHAVKKVEGDVYGYAVQTFQLAYDCSATDAGLKLSVFPGTLTLVDGAGVEREVALRPYATAYAGVDE